MVTDGGQRKGVWLNCMRNDLLGLLGGLFLSGGSSVGRGAGDVETRTVEVDSDIFHYQVYVSGKLRNERNLPIIIFLHGIRERGSGGFVPTTGPVGMLVRRYFAQVPAVILLPQCRPGKYWSDPAMDKMVMGALGQTVEEFGADEKRIYLSGVSMGGYGVWHFAAEHPGAFAALVAICGGSPLAGGDRFTPIVEKVGKTPAWIFHGAKDNVVQVSESRQIVAAFKTRGNEVKYSEYPNSGHNVWLDVLAEKDLMPWLLRQKRGEKVSA